MEAVRKAAQEFVSQHASITQKVRILAVSKRHPANKLVSVYETGQRHFGENYLQEMAEKAAALPPSVEQEITWHLIGPLAANKVAGFAQFILGRARHDGPPMVVWETCSSLERAQKLHDRLARSVNSNMALLQVYVQINISGQEQRHGCMAHEAEALCVSLSKTCPLFEVSGLMALGSVVEEGDPAALKCVEDEFKAMHALKTQIETKLGRSLELSMGMSADYRLALLHGSTQIRIGTAIFGPR